MNMLQEESGKGSSMRVISLLLTIGAIAVSCFGFYTGRDAFDIVMVAGMLLGGGLTGKLVQKPMERVK